MKNLVIATLAVALAGCASSSVLVGPSRPPIDPAQVRLYLDPPPQFEKVALLDAGSKNSWAITDQGKTNKVIERLKEEAAALGANGVLISGVGEQQIGSVGSGQAWGYGNTAYGLGFSGGVFQKKGAGLAIYVPPQAAAAAVPVQATPAATLDQQAPVPPAQPPAALPAAPAPAPGHADWRGWGSKGT